MSGRPAPSRSTPDSPIDVAVNNAGISGQKTRLAEMDTDYFDSVIRVNLRGVFLSMKYELPVMVEQGGGSIVNISSVSGIRAAPATGSAYVAAKFGVVGLTVTAALEYAKKQIRVNCLAPGLVETAQARKGFPDPKLWERVMAFHPLGRAGTPEDIAHAIAYIASDEASFVTGAVFPIDGGANL